VGIPGQSQHEILLWITDHKYDFGCKFEQSPSTKLEGYILLHLESVA